MRAELGPAESPAIEAPSASDQRVVATDATVSMRKRCL